ncbi:bifunctional AP-4-A phosphorylase/ADP sulfurylase [Linderina macrospora]|uniref:Bifunctional AP-4-A phosphorylase/ADP sulfurylase n=1 Tax=Linderina macrospora TaxID=4868 RepID=A0ACC1J4L1_9FUNG|nr:bifunctional AP-4-A phosphorylase/ADP sulfurylase [Linderina macrospora]
MSKPLTELDVLVRDRYASAVSNGSLLFTDSEIAYKQESNMSFEIRFVPALAKKPSSKPKEKQQSKTFVNPFLPFDPNLHVKTLATTHHELLLNKYCIVPNHLLITTAAFAQQGEPLTAGDFAAAASVLEGMSTPQIVFYNAGEESGASQPHKHMQVLPMPDRMADPPVMQLWLSEAPPGPAVAVSRKLPFAHFGVRLGDSLDPVAIEDAYARALATLTAKYSTSASYNMVMTKHALMLFPRRQNAWSGIGINSLGFAGLLLCKTKEEMGLVEDTGVLGILTQVGFSSSDSQL